MSKTPLTRMALLVRRAQIATSRRGVEVLRAKRDALLRELYRAFGQALEFRQRAGELASRAALALASARGSEGSGSIDSLAAASRREVLVEIELGNVWGVKIPQLRAAPTVRRSVDRGYGIVATSAAVDDAAEAHEQLVAFVLEQAPQEIRLRRLAAELRRTTRKVNTLEQTLLPQLEADVRRIEAGLEEQEREDRFRLELSRGERS